MYASSATAIDQGVIVDWPGFQEVYEDSAAVILTPQCDIEHKADFLTVAACVPAMRLVTECNALGKIRDKIGNLMAGKEYRWYWLAPIGHFDIGAVVDFQLVTSTTAVQIEGVPILGALEPPWREHLASQYARYTSRVGLPEESDQQKRARRDAIASELWNRKGSQP